MDVIKDAITILITVLAWRILSGRNLHKENKDYIDRKIEERNNQK